MQNVSIAMCTYNGEEFIEPQLQSLRAQTLVPAELIVCDDGSTDRTIEILKQFSTEVPFPVKLFVNAERLGYKANFQKAANLCSSELIAFCDQDDIWLPEKLQRCVQMFSKPDVLLCHHDYKIVDGKLQIIAPSENLPLETGIHKSTLDPRLNPRGFTLVFSRKLLDFRDKWAESIDYEDEALRECHDQWFPGLAAGLGRVAYIKEPLVLYRQHGGNLSHWGAYPKTLAGLNLRMRDHRLHLYSEFKSFDRRSKFFAEAASATSGEMQSNAQIAAAMYKNLAATIQLRIALMNEPGLLGKVADVFKAIHSGAYRPKTSGGPGRRALIKDLLYSVPRIYRENTYGMGT
jgi:glycosyltransferase involved in cell wall biosynthesis